MLIINFITRGILINVVNVKDQTKGALSQGFLALTRQQSSPKDKNTHIQPYHLDNFKTSKSTIKASTVH